MDNLEIVNFFTGLGFDVKDQVRVISGFLLFNDKSFVFFLDAQEKTLNFEYKKGYARRDLIFQQKFTSISELKNLIENNQVYSNRDTKSL